MPEEDFSTKQVSTIRTIVRKELDTKLKDHPTKSDLKKELKKYATVEVQNRILETQQYMLDTQNRIIDKLQDHDVSLDRIEERIADLPTRAEMFTMWDDLSTKYTFAHDEVLANTGRVSRCEEDIERLKKHTGM